MGFTLVELLVILVLLCFLVTLLVPALARSQPTSKTFQCQNNVRQLYSAWRQWADDHNDRLVAAQNLNDATRPNWVTGTLDWSGANPSNFDTNQDLARGPLWTYLTRNPNVFKCPADPSVVLLGYRWNGLPAGTFLPRVRNISMSGVFGSGGWLDGGPNPNQTKWRTYAQIANIVLPAQTFVFIDEHPDSVNDGVLNVECTGAQLGDPPSSARIIDFPASFHNGAANLSFADGHALTHQWLSSAMRVPYQLAYLIPLNVPAGDAWRDAQWLAQNTTVKR